MMEHMHARMLVEQNLEATSCNAVYLADRIMTMTCHFMLNAAMSTEQLNAKMLAL